MVDLRDEAKRARLMAIITVEEVWGIGRRLTAKLESQGIHTVTELVSADAKSLRWRHGVVVERTVQEQRGIPCAGLEEIVKAKQQIICSRSVGERITQIGAMHQALVGYMERAAKKLRAEGMCCRHITLFIRNSPFNDKEPYYGNQISPRVAIPTYDTRALLALIGPLLSNIWREGHCYQKGGVMLADFTPDSIQQGDLFTSEQQSQPSNAADAGGRQEQSGRNREGLLWHKGTGYQRMDDEAGAAKSAIHYLYQRSSRSKGISMSINDYYILTTTC